MAEPGGTTIPVPETAHEYGWRSTCFLSHRNAPFRFEDQAIWLRETIQDNDLDELGLVRQPGLVPILLPYPRIDVWGSESPDEIDNYLEMLDDDSLAHKYSAFSILPLAELRLSPEAIDLGYDTSKDVFRYLHEIRKKLSCNLASSWVPLITVDSKKDEGLSFPSASSRWHCLVNRELVREEIGVSDGASFLLRCTTAPTSDVDDFRMNKQDLGIKREGEDHPERLTPPMSPTSDVDSQFIPSPRVAVIDLTSEPSSPIPYHVDQLQKNAGKGGLDSDITVMSSLSSSPPKTQLLGHLYEFDAESSNLKIDVPLVPSSSSIPENDPLDIFTHIHTSIPDLYASEESFFDEALDSILSDKQSGTLQALEQEHLITSTSALRLQVPNLDFTVPRPDWISTSSNPKSQFSWLRRVNPLLFQHLYSGCSVPRGIELRWIPVPQGWGQIHLKESLEVNEETRKYILADISGICSGNYITKRISPSILRSTDDDEIGLEYINSGASVSPVREHEVAESSGSNTREEQSLSRYGLLGLKILTTRDSIKRKATDELNTLLPQSADSSATSKLLSNFMNLRAPKRTKLDRQDALRSTPDFNHSGYAQKSSNPTMVKNDSVDKNTNVELVKAPTPCIKLPPGKYRFIISLGLPRSIFRYLEKSWPDADFIDRDFSHHDTLSWSPGTTDRKKVVSPLSFEADAALSPSVGIITTTLLKVRQKSLPGSPSPSSFRARVHAVSQKYEVLLILVSESNPAGEFIGKPSAADLIAYSDFMQFTSTLEARVTAYYVSGADITVSKWLSALLSSFAPRALNLSHFLSPDENSWEVFLRRAGMNVYAAQVLSGLLMQEHGNWGLVFFLGLSTEERVEKYAQLFGGQRVLQRISQLVDQEWV